MTYQLERGTRVLLKRHAEFIQQLNAVIAGDRSRCD